MQYDFDGRSREMTNLNTDTMLDYIRREYNLKSLGYLPFHVNSQDHTDYSFVSGYKGFFGPEVYDTRSIYNRTFQWCTQKNKTYLVVIEPKIKSNRYIPTEDDGYVLEQLRGYIEESLWVKN